ncbi:MAG TPA: DUF47 family protein [Fimbriimonadaceae bacterium]|jgi:hypothetical protein
MNLSIQKDTVFHELLASQAEVAYAAAVEFHNLSKDFGGLAGHIDKLNKIESQGDDLTHELQTKVTDTFITPLDKEDLRLLSQALDDVTDMVEAAAVRIDLYNIDKPRLDLEPMVAGLVRATSLVVEAMKLLKNGIHKTKSFEEKLEQIHTAENENDVLFREALRSLFHEATDPLYVMKWKEIYDRVEVAVDKCEDIAKISGMILTKYA